MKYSMVLEGPDQVRGAAARREQVKHKTEWPYPYLFAPPGAIRVTAGADSSGTLIVPVAATPTQGLIYTVDEGYLFALERLVVIYMTAGAQGNWNPGDATWSLTVDQPVGVVNYQGMNVQGLTNVDVPLGSLQFPWPLECPEIFSPNDTVRIAFTNTNLNSGAGNYFKSILLGWRWPGSVD